MFFDSSSFHLNFTVSASFLSFLLIDGLMVRWIPNIHDQDEAERSKLEQRAASALAAQKQMKIESARAHVLQMAAALGVSNFSALLASLGKLMKMMLRVMTGMMCVFG
jgi:hypothetical protein